MELMLEDFRKIFCKHVDVEPEEVEELNRTFGITVDAHRACGLITVKDALEYFSSLKDSN